MADLLRLQKRLRTHAAGRFALGALSLGFAAAVLLRAALYRLGVLRRRRLPIRTVCFGNLTTGGTGKTSAVLLAAEQLAEKGAKPAVLSRGYRRPNRKPASLALGPGADWKDAGDEPWMIHESLKDLGVKVIVGADRYASGVMAASEFGADVALLDDGFQHLSLERDADVVLVNAADPFGGGLLPFGLAREPLGALRRATLIVLTHADRVSKERLEEIREELRRVAPRVPTAAAVHKARHVWDPRKLERLPLARLKGREVVALSALGDPGSFERLLASLGARIAQSWRYPDHHVYTPVEARSLENARGNRAVVTTFKDLPRLPADWDKTLTGDVWALAVGLKIVQGQDAWKKAVLA